MRANSASAQSSDACAFITSGTPFGIERLAAREPEARLDLAGVRFGFLQLRRGLGGGDAHQQRRRRGRACRVRPASR